MARFCVNCGKELSEREKFCTSCGTPVRAAAAKNTDFRSAEEGDTPGKTMASACPACGGQMVFDPESGKLKCAFCDSLFSPEEVEAAWKEKEEKTTGGGGHALLGPEDQMLSYGCSACGAELMADRTTAVMRCPYCGNQTIVPAQFSGQIRPDYIIPFAHTKKEAEAKYLSFYEKRFLLPKSFKTDNHVQEIQGVYVPFWMFSGRTYVNGRYLAYDESEDSNGNTTRSAYYEEIRQGYIDYKNVPADASRRMEDDLMDSVEPYNLNELKDFSMSYLPGFMAERFDVDEEECQARAHSRAEGSISDQVRKTIKRDGIDVKKEYFRYEGEETKYAMLPVWLLVTKWNDRTYKFAMNGQTGKMVGDLPVSAPKLMGVTIPLFLLLMILGMIFIGDFFGVLIVALLIAGVTAAIMYGSMKSVKKASNASGYITQELQLSFKKEEKVGMFKVTKVRNEIKAMGNHT